jgi:hypothetical protein
MIEELPRIRENVDRDEGRAVQGSIRVRTSTCQRKTPPSLPREPIVLACFGVQSFGFKETVVCRKREKADRAIIIQLCVAYVYIPDAHNAALNSTPKLLF